MAVHALPSRTDRPFRPAELLEAVDHPTRRRLLDDLRRNGPQDALTLADAHELSSLKLHHHLRTLREAGLIRLRGEGATATATFSAIGWARLKRRWERGLTSQVGLRVVE